MIGFGLALLCLGIAIFFIGIVIDYTAVDCFAPPAIACILIAFAIMVVGAFANETTPDTSTTQTIETNQEISDTNHYNYCPNCGYNFCESKEN